MEKTTKKICCNCAFAGAQFKVKRLAHLHCSKPEYTKQQEQGEVVSPWETLRTFGATCSEFCYKLAEGDRVYCYDIDDSKCYGVLKKNTEYTNISEWYIEYEDGQECAVLDISQVFKK